MSGSAPDLPTPAGGRCLVRQAVFLDPATYATGRMRTIAGIVESGEDRVIKEISRRYPVIRA